MVCLPDLISFCTNKSNSFTKKRFVAPNPLRMTNTTDLHIEDEILPLFDFTFNYHSGQAVRSVLQEPLGSTVAILARQQIFKGFIAHHAILKDYSFSRFNLAELFDFLETFAVGSLSGGKLRWKLTFSEKERHQKRGKLIQMILLFHKIQSAYTTKIDSKLFPPDYAAELQQLNGFFGDFRPEHYETVFKKKKKLGVNELAELIEIIATKTANGQMAAFWKRWFQFEANLSISHGIIKHGLAFPVFTETGFAVEGLFHPLLKNPVRNNLVADKNVILLTGPNMSGKSTFLKAVSLCVYLGHTGVAVPAAKASMPFFSTISVAINLTDSIVSGYSHFMTEIITLKNVLQEAEGNHRCFAVFDELFRGTNIEDALEISTATIKGLTRFTHSLFFISTHLHQLRDLEEIKTGQVSTWYIDCTLNNNSPIFTYQLKEGWSDLKIGRILFEKEGLNRMLNR
jgi:DNA mismatch repair protein MutS